MFETTRYEGGRRLRGTAALSVGLALLSAFILWYYTVIPTDEVDELLETFPPALLDAFGIKTLATIEGFLAAEIYGFLWVLGLGLYFAYTAGGLIAGDVERDRMDLLLSFPISRARLLVEKVGALLVALVALNVVVGVAVYAGSVAIGETIDPTRLAMVHLLSAPYLLACAGIGTVFSVLFDRADVAKRAAIGLLFVLYLLDSIASSAADFAWIRLASPTHYYDPTAVLVDGTYDLGGAAILLGSFAALLTASAWVFRRRDV